jgi:uncharacterized protein YecA (UPF0149 family)
MRAICGLESTSPYLVSQGEKTVMDPQNPESSAPASLSTEFDSSVQAGSDCETVTGEAELDAQTLVDQMVEAGEWPKPALLEKILDASDAAVPPLISVLRTYPRGWPAEAPLDHAMGLLSILRPPAAVPELIEIIRRYGEESGEGAAHFLGRFGAVAFEPLLNVCRDRAVAGYPLIHAISAALAAAGDDRSLKAQLADVVRPMLADVIERVRQAKRGAETVEPDEFDDETLEYEPESDLADISEIDDEPDDDQIEDNSQGSHQTDAECALGLYDEVFHLVNFSAALADPGARDLIQTAFDEDMVETFLIDQDFVELQYQRGGDPVRVFPNWLDTYREQYHYHHDIRPSPSPKPFSVRPPQRERRAEQAESRSPVQLNTPLRNTGPAVGRNEPCWCGSGKKYKKCHLGKDARS